MNWLFTLFQQDSVAHGILVLGLVIALGLALGSVRIFGVSLGVAGVLFAGILFGHFGLTVNRDVLEFVRDFGLVFFVFMIGLQVGPGFFASLRRQGLAMNALAAGTVLLGAGVALLVHFVAPMSIPAVTGLLAGATTNTPSLAAAGQALRQVPGTTEAILKLPDLAYAVSYPFGILGTILAMLAVRWLFKVDVAAEKINLREESRPEHREIHTLSIEVTNPQVAGVAIARLPGLGEAGAVVSRVLHDGVTSAARPETTLATGDVIFVVGPPAVLKNFCALAGRPSPLDLRATSSDLAARRVIVTQPGILGKTVGEVDLIGRFGINVTRVARGDQQFPPSSSLRIQFSDLLTLVGPEAQLAPAEALLGNSLKDLNQPRLLPVFVGIVLGILLGSLPLLVPGLPAPVKLGLAGGPLVVAILLSRLGHWGPLIWYLPTNANYLLREIGIALFLGCVGLKSGDSFLPILRHGDGLHWMLWGTVITFVPLFTVGVLARGIWKLNYINLCGLLAGSMTDPPALAFATSLAATEEVAVSYVTVYPLTMILRVFIAQLMVLFFMG